MLDRPDVCSTVSIVDQFKPYMYDESKGNIAKKMEKEEAIKVQARRVVEFDKSLVGLEKRAEVSEILFGIVLVAIINMAIFCYCKFYNKS